MMNGKERVEEKKGAKTGRGGLGSPAIPLVKGKRIPLMDSDEEEEKIRIWDEENSDRISKKE